jgi:hypothetical protein
MIRVSSNIRTYTLTRQYRYKAANKYDFLSFLRNPKYTSSLKVNKSTDVIIYSIWKSLQYAQQPGSIWRLWHRSSGSIAHTVLW